MEELSLANKLAIWIIPAVFGITVHEVAHGWVANYFGDPTARLAGRLTLNPFRHVDPVGTVVVPLLLLLFSSVILGWARPVPVDASRLRHPRRDMALVALAGPGSNLLMALLWALVVKLALLYHSALSGAAVLLIFMGVAGVYINTILCVLNLLPLPPLDGGRVFTSVLPPRWASVVGRIEPLGILILLALLFTGLLWEVVVPSLEAAGAAMNMLIGVSRDFFFQMLFALFGAG